MQIIIKGRQMEVAPQLRQRIERKVQRLSRLINEAARIEVTVSEEQTRSMRDRFSVQLVVSDSSQPVRSEVSALTASTALDLALDKIVVQLGRHKDRQTTVRRHHTPAVKVLALSRSGHLSAMEDEELYMNAHSDSPIAEEQNEEIWSRVMEIRRLPTKSMDDKEVIANMEKSGVSFLPFFNDATNSVNVMYKLESGGYGLLVPAIEV